MSISKLDDLDLDDMGDFWRSIRAGRQEKRHQNLKSSIDILNKSGLEFKQLSDDHIRIGEFDFWPSTGLFIHMKTKKRGRGVFKLLRELDRFLTTGKQGTHITLKGIKS